MPKSKVADLGLKPGLIVRGVLADGRESRLKTFVGWIDWFGELLEVEIVSGDGQTTLLGVGLLLGRRLTVDYGCCELNLN